MVPWEQSVITVPQMISLVSMLHIQSSSLLVIHLCPEQSIGRVAESTLLMKVKEKRRSNGALKIIWSPPRPLPDDPNSGMNWIRSRRFFHSLTVLEAMTWHGVSVEANFSSFNRTLCDKANESIEPFRESEWSGHHHFKETLVLNLTTFVSDCSKTLLMPVVD